jgi:hypothetical protein
MQQGLFHGRILGISYAEIVSRNLAFTVVQRLRADNAHLSKEWLISLNFLWSLNAVSAHCALARLNEPH